MKTNDIFRGIGVAVMIFAALAAYRIYRGRGGGEEGEMRTAQMHSQPETSTGERRSRPHASGSEGFSVIRNPQIQPLSRSSNPTAEQCLEALASSSFEADRVRAAMILGQRAKEEGLSVRAVPALVNALDHDEASQVGLVCAQSLGKYGVKASSAVPSLMKWFDHPIMRDVAIDSLAEIGSPAKPAIELISPIALNQDERFISRRKAIEALARIGGSDDPAVAVVFASVKDDPDPRIRNTADQPLKSSRIGGP